MVKPAAVLLQLCGLIALIVGAFLLAFWLGFIVAGVALFVVGLFMERLVFVQPVEEGSDARVESRP